MNIANTVIDLIGNTPLVRINADTGRGVPDLLESMNWCTPVSA
jgi:cysteine synthase